MLSFQYEQSPSGVAIIYTWTASMQSPYTMRPITAAQVRAIRTDFFRSTTQYSDACRLLIEAVDQNKAFLEEKKCIKAVVPQHNNKAIQRGIVDQFVRDLRDGGWVITDIFCRDEAEAAAVLQITL